MGSKLLLLIAAALVAGAWWWRKNPSACPYAQRFWVEAPHPLITRARLRETLQPRPGERILEIGPGTGYYTLHLAGWIGRDGRLDVVDLQRQMLDHTMRRVANAGLANVHPAHADAQELPYEDASFDAAVLITVLGEVPNQERALAEIARVLRPDGRLVVGEVLGDPHYVTVGTLQRKAEDAGLRFERRHGTVAGYFARLAH